MPQLAVSTFSSQIFWVLVGFLLVYVFITNVVTPKIEETLENRTAHIDGLLRAANQLKTEAGKLEFDASAAFENAQIDASAAEAKLIAEFREQSIKEKKSLYSLFAEKSKEESATLAKSAEEAFVEISDNMEELLDKAMENISCTIRDKS